jgi:2-dehydro-3-deoxyphosphogluconate aldolase/(4S)-4-hydroxy-2-oxoglutarate aldolase
MTGEQALERLAGEQLVAVLRVERPGQTAPAVAALRDGGIAAIELTYTSPDTAAELAAARAAHGDAILLGAGTLRSAADVRTAAEAGADFLVSPHLDTGVLRAMTATGLLALPGVFTPTEVAAALEGGAEAVKLFPASSAGLAHLKALRGPLPRLRVVPTGGIGLDDVRDWLTAGSLAVGVGGELCRKDLIENGRWDELRELAARYAAVARERG